MYIKAYNLVHFDLRVFHCTNIGVIHNSNNAIPRIRASSSTPDCWKDPISRSSGVVCRFSVCLLERISTWSQNNVMRVMGPFVSKDSSLHRIPVYSETNLSRKMEFVLLLAN
ncbi:hypothetical protein CDAR_576261 [Caerostris darwini]|uniref:Uncharacterized protein n=1 Tax=Caerostris darwini TaxID=1538125 RepID=A0AAV4QA01_9ARAC|nr:hypothetical protein CDAR_576261 [Caerostris darwini]